MTAEQQSRLDDIRNGPWRWRSKFARRWLPVLSGPDLARCLRPHFGDNITDRVEIAFRDSFDNALEELQLLELAVSCNFLPLEAAGSAARPAIDSLLSSAAARRYVEVYDFVPVRYLAARLGVDLGLAAVAPPPVDTAAEVRFAAFLASHYEFAANRQIRRFSRFLDDFYYTFPNWQVDAAFLKRQAAAAWPALGAQERTIVAEGLLGLIQFVEVLGDFFLQVPAAQQPYFGLGYAYWLSHFFGLRRPRRDYEPAGASFEDFSFDQALFLLDLDPAAVETERKRYSERVGALRRVWDATHELILGAR